MRIKVFTTGGSIDKGYSTRESAFVVGEPRVGDVLRDANVDLQFEIESITKKDSLELTDEDRVLIVDRVRHDPSRHILITHGTDTMPLTARALSAIRDKVIVLTGAMQPAAFRTTDAHFNVGFAIAALQTLPPGVYIAMNGRIFDPDNVEKDLDKDRFQHPGGRREIT